MTDSAPIAVTVIGGYLGAGKTTLVNHLLRVGTGRRTTVLVNDFGSIAIDQDLIVSNDGAMIGLANGCVCCGLSGTLMETMSAIRNQPDPPEYLVIEASGVADPGPISHHALTPGYRLDGVVVVADAETVRRRSADRVVGRTVQRQLRAAEVLVLNKLDLVDADAAHALQQWARTMAPDAVILDAVEAQVPVQLLLGVHADSALARLPAVDTFADESHAHHETWSWIFDAPIRRDALESWIAGMDESVVRAKGIVWLADDPERRYTLQVVGRRCRLVADRPWGDTPRQTRIVVIALPGASRPSAPY
ncbi:MAG: GTP-binding protein [Actinomycetota bacterium]